MASFQQNERGRDPQSAAGSNLWHGSHGAGDMAEVPVTCLLGSLGPLLQRLEVLMDSEGNLPRGVNKSDLRHLRRDLEEVARSVIEISREENPHFTDKLWVKEVRELSYDAEDYLDMMLNSASGIRQFPWIQKRQKGPRIAKDISDLRSRLQQARDRRHRYHPVKAKLHTEHIGLEEPMDTVVNLLDLDKEPNLKVVPIFGVAGVGKTTLATRLYHHYGGSFHRRAFLRVSRKPDIRRLLTSMLSQIKGPKPCTDVQDLINNIRTCLENKAYFIVLDDLWDTPVWDIISHAFPASKCYSRIITTTEIERVALACCSYHTKDMYRMDPLNPNEAQKLLLSRAFGSEDECHGEELKDVSDAIIKNSDGLPLAVIPMASMLASWSKNVTEHKKYIQETLRLHATSEWMKEILNLVYSDLPDHLKTCLLYFNMYPEDYVIRKDDLVKQWVAEGFLTAVKLQDMEQVAGIYFDELVTRGMIQPLETNSNDEVLSCAVHHMVLDLIACKSTEENFITVMYHSETITGLPDKVRRLSLKFGAAESARITGSFRMSQVRSLVFSGFFRSVPSLVEYRLLQVLILHIWSDQDKTNFNLSRIQEMFRLRYLKVESNMTVKLPASIAGLQCLGTIEIDAIVTAIPSDIVHLQRLLHLRLPSGTHLPHGIGHLTSLRSLSYLNIGTSSRENVLDLNKLTNLHDLHLTCSKVRSKRLHSNMKLLGSILSSINLRSLTLDGGASSDDSIPCEFLGSIPCDFCPPFLLETLKLSPGIFIFFHIPKWVGELSKLCVLKIAVKELSSDDVDTLKELRALSALSLYVQVTPEKVVIDKNGFLVLKNFKFICRVPCVEFMSGAMHNVRRLKLGFSAYRGLEQCSGLEHLESLSVVYAKVEGAGVDDSRRKAIQSQLKDIFKTSPVFQEKKTSPVVNVLWVDRVFGDKETHPGSRPTTSSSGPSSSATNPDTKTKSQEKKHQIDKEQLENVDEDSEEHTIAEKALGASAMIDLSTEASPCTFDQVESEDDRSTGTEKEAIRTTNVQDDTKEDELKIGHGPPNRELGDATKERGGSMHFESKELSSNLQYPPGDDNEKLTLIKLASMIEVAAKKGAGYLNLQGKLMNQIEWLPDSIGKLTGLVTLDISENQILALPEAIGRLPSLAKLDVHSNRIAQLPEWIGDLPNLIYLDLRGNQLASLPASLGRLVKLEELDVSANHLTSLPDAIGSLTRLMKLIVETNNLDELPYTIGNCVSLVELRAGYNHLKALPEAVGKLESLEVLSVRYNRIRGLPTTMASLTKLKEFDASFNELKSIPENFCFVTSLVKLNVGKNFADLQSLPRSIGNLEMLEELDISNNQIRVLPDSFGNLQHLRVLRAEENPLQVPPRDVALTGAQAAVQYMAEFAKKATRSQPTKTKKTWAQFCFSPFLTKDSTTG